MESRGVSYFLFGLFNQNNVFWDSSTLVYIPVHNFSLIIEQNSIYIEYIMNIDGYSIVYSFSYS